MPPSSIVRSPPRRMRSVLTWILRTLLALVFGAAGVAKLAGATILIAEFNQIGLGQWFRYATGLVEIAGALLVLWPLTTFFGALVLMCVCIGAFVAQIGPLHGDLIHVVVLAVLVGLTVWLTRPRSAATQWQAQQG